MIWVFQYISELCEFKEEGGSIFGQYNNTGSTTNTKEECALKVRGEFPNATGVSWYEDGGSCYAQFGNWLVDVYSKSGRHTCLFHGIRYYNYQYIL